MSPEDAQRSQAMERFLRRVWQADVAPLLRGRNARQRGAAARVGGTIAGLAGTFVDGLLRLRGRPATRAMTVLGASLGAMVPDLWDWDALRRLGGRGGAAAAAEQVRRRAKELSDSDALALFNLTPSASREQLQHAWRLVSQRWHPDKAADETRRAEHHVTFVAYQAAYERLCEAYENGRLPNNRP